MLEKTASSPFLGVTALLPCFDNDVFVMLACSSVLCFKRKSVSKDNPVVRLDYCAVLCTRCLCNTAWLCDQAGQDTCRVSRTWLVVVCGVTYSQRGSYSVSTWSS